MTKNKPLLKIAILTIVLLTAVIYTGTVLSGEYKKKAYEPSWKSIMQHPIPEWFRDAKFGIYFHWGVYSVPAYENEWYPRNMYREGSAAFQHHRATFGPQEEFGYKDFISSFTAEKFNADEWVDLFVKSGAQYVGPVAEHHDGFAMWESDLTDWDASDMGPKRDIVGELEQAVRKRGLKFCVSFHHAFNWKFYEPAFAYDAKDPVYAGLYGYPHFPGIPESEEFLEDWLGKIVEVVDKYQPDYIWFDFGWQEPTFESYKREMLAYYYNQAEEWNREVVVTYKHDHLPRGAAVLDLERGRLDSLRKETWITDTSIDRKSWCYIRDPEYKSANTLIDNLADRVSKNGNTLLNIAPRPDGTIPDEQKERLLEIGDWLKINGEAIYGTRHWVRYGEGPTQMKGGAFSERNEVRYTSRDIRFTVKGNVLYAIALDWPEEALRIASLKDIDENRIKSVGMLGVSEELTWSKTPEGLRIEMPHQKPCEHAFAFKIVFQEKVPGR